VHVVAAEVIRYRLRLRGVRMGERTQDHGSERNLCRNPFAARLGVAAGTAFARRVVTANASTTATPMTITAQ
jgi:hypothetical protein